MLHTLYQQNVQARTTFFVEWMALDLIRDASGAVVGVTALEMETGETYILEAKTTLLWPPAVLVASLRLPPTRSSTPATAWVWPLVRGCHCKTWSFGSSTPPA
jgi:hypothetical protein